MCRLSIDFGFGKLQTDCNVGKGIFVQALFSCFTQSIEMEHEQFDSGIQLDNEKKLLLPMFGFRTRKR